MILEIILNAVNNPTIATTIACIALFISLYVLYIQHASKGRKRKKVFVSKPVFSFDAQGQYKDVIILISVILIMGGIFVLYTLFTKLEVKKYIKVGTEHIYYSLAKNVDSNPQSAAVKLSQENIVQETFETKNEKAIDVTKTEVATPTQESGKVNSIQMPQQTLPTSTEKPVPATVPKIQVEPMTSTPPPVIVPIIAIEKPTESKKEENPEATGDAPDAALSTLSYYGGELIERSILSFSVIVANEGKRDMEVPFHTQLFIDNENDGKINLQLSRIETRPLKIGERETKIWKSAWEAKGGTHRMEVCTDVYNAILEMNEKKNCTDLILTIKENEVTGDLIIEKVTVNPQVPIEGQSVSFSARVKNIGDQASLGSYTYLKIDGGFLGRIRTPSIQREKYEDVDSVWQATPGSHPYEVCADGRQEVFESNEGNNCSVGTVQVK